MLSSGNSDNESAFLEATPSGNDVFFLTAAQLVPQDTDTTFDIYDARVCTPSSPCLSPPAASTPECQTASECRSWSATLPLPVGPSGSATASGTGRAVQAAGKRGVKGVKGGWKPLNRAQKLANALKACRKGYARSKKKRRFKEKRVACEVRARKRYAARTKAKKNSRPRKSSGGRSPGKAGR